MTRRRTVGVLAACSLLFVGLAAVASAGGIYRFIDARGVIHFSDIPYDSRYRMLESRPPDLALSPLPRPSVPVNHGFDSLIAHVARAYGVEPALVKAVVAAESNFDIGAISRVGAQGLMQLMPSTALEMGVRAPFRPWDNLKGGVRYLREMLDRYGDVRRALAAYNAGPSAVDRHGGVPPFPETEAYVSRVLNYYHIYQGHFPR